MAESISSKSLVESPWRLPIDSNFQRRTSATGVFSDDPINLCELPVAMAASVDLVSLDCGPSQIMVDLTPGYIVSAVVGFSFVQRDSFDDVKEDDRRLRSPSYSSEHATFSSAASTVLA